jgi:DNA-binding transcriptional regulator YiaG
MGTAVGTLVGSKRATVGRNTSAEDLSTYSGRVGARIRKRREAVGVSVDELADACGVTVQTIYAWEAGRNAINLNALPLIAAKIKSSPHKLLPLG